MPKMSKAKKWTAHEAEAAAKAQPHDSVNSSGQRSEDFAKRTCKVFFRVVTAPGVVLVAPKAVSVTETPKEPKELLGILSSTKRTQ